MKILATIALLSSLLFPQCVPVDLTLGSASLQRGQTQTIQSVVTNCASTKEKLRVTVTVTDATGVTDLIRNTQHIINGGASITLNDTFAVPGDAPIGTWRVITIVFLVAGGSTTEIARDTQEFQVTS